MTANRCGDDAFDAPSESGDLENMIDARLVRVTAPEGAALVVVTGARAGTTVPLGTADTVVGRAEDAGVSIDERAVSHRHAKIIAVEGRHQIVDLGSTNGTHVNGERIARAVTLYPGDVVRVGETTLNYVTSQPDRGAQQTIVLHDPTGGRELPYDSGFLPRAPRTSSTMPPDEPGIRELLVKILSAYRFLKRHRALFIVLALIGSAAGGFTGKLIPPPAVASFEIRLTPKVAPNPVQDVGRESIEFFAAAETSFVSPELIAKTLSELDGAPPAAKTVEATAERVHFETTGHLTYRGAFTDPSSDRALAFLQRHVALYLDGEIEKTLKVLRAEVDFLEKQIHQSEAELEQTESALSAFKAKNLSGLPEQARDQFGALINLRTRESALSAELERMSLELDMFRSRATSDDSALRGRVESTQPFRDALIDVQQKLGGARARGLGDAHPEVVALRKQATELERLNDSALTADVTEMERRTDARRSAMRDRAAELEVAVKGADKELRDVRSQIARIDAVVRKLPEVEAEYAQLTRSYDATKELHTKMFQRFKASQVQLELERASTRARYDLTTPPKVVQPSAKKTIAIAGVLGMVAGLSLALLVAGIVELRRYVVRANL